MFICNKKIRERRKHQSYSRGFWTLPSINFSKLWLGLFQTPLVSPFVSKKLQNSSKLKKISFFKYFDLYFFHSTANSGGTVTPATPYMGYR
jgi:hypothetical protein